MVHHHRSPVVPRRALLGGAAAIPAGVLLAGCGDDPEPTTPDGPPDRVTYVTAVGHLGREGYAHTAVAKGFFAEQNLEVTIEPGAGGPPNHQAVAGGAAQFASVDSSGAFARHAAGEDELQIISAVQQLPLAAIVTVEGNDIVGPQDLEGKTIGGLPGSVIEDLFPAYADLAGFDPAAVQFENMDAASLFSALAAGQVDAIGLFLVGAPQVEAATGRPAVVLPYSDFLYDLYGAVHVAPRSLIEQQPDLVARFNTALLQGLEYAVAHPQEAGELLHAAEPATDAEVAAGELEIMAPYVRGSLPADQPTGTMESSRVARSVAVLTTIGYVSDGALTYEQDIMAWGVIPGDGEAQ